MMLADQESMVISGLENEAIVGQINTLERYTIHLEDYKVLL